MSYRNRYLQLLAKNDISILIVFAAILHFAIIHTLHLFTFAQITDKPLDSYSYENAANLLYSSLKPSAIRPAGYPLLIGIPYLFWIPENLHMYWVYIMHFFLWLGTAFLIYKIIILISHNKWFARLGMLLFCFNLGNLAFTVQTLTETVYTFLLILFSFLFVKYLLSRMVNYLSWAFFVLCFSVIIKPALFYFIPFIFLYVLYYLKSRFRKGSFLISTMGLSLIVFQISLMYSRYGHIAISFIDKSTLYNCIDAEAAALKENRPLNIVRNERNEKLIKCFREESWDSFGQMAQEDFKEQLHHNLKNLIKAYETNLIVNSKDGSNLLAEKYNSDPGFFIDKLSWISCFQNLVNVVLLLCVVPILWLFNFGKKLFRLPCIALFIIALEAISLFIYLSSGLCFFQGDRYCIVFYPLTLVSCFACIDYLKKARK